MWLKFAASLPLIVMTPSPGDIVEAWQNRRH